MGIKKQKFSDQSFRKLTDYLLFYDSIEKPIEYEVLVDGISAVRPTRSVLMLLALGFPMFAELTSLEVILYRENSKEKDKFIFTFDKLGKS